MLFIVSRQLYLITRCVVMTCSPIIMLHILFHAHLAMEKHLQFWLTHFCTLAWLFHRLNFKRLIFLQEQMDICLHRPLGAVQIRTTILKPRIWFLYLPISIQQPPANCNTKMPAAATAAAVWPLATGPAFQRVMVCLRVHEWFHCSSHHYAAFSKA